MGMLADVGRADLVDKYQRYKTNLSNLETAGLSRDVTRQNMGITEQGKQLNEQAINKNAYIMQKQKEQDAIDEAPFNIRLSKRFIDLPEDTQKTLLEYGQQMGAWDATGVGKRKHATEFITNIYTEPESMQTFIYPAIQKREELIIQNKQKMAKDAMEGKPTDEKLKQQTDLLEKDYTQRLGIYQAQVNKLLGLKAEAGDKTSDTQLYSILKNSTDPTEIQRAKDMIEFRRAQPEEVSGVTYAKRNAEAATAERIKYNEGIGKALAEIATVRQIEAEKVIGEGKETDIVKKASAKGRMTNNLAALGNHFLQLDSMGSIVNVEENSLDNLLAATSSSTVGQYIGQRLGTDAQSIRESINKLRPLIIQDIRQATNMGARGLDSEKELEFYMKSATDPKTDIQSNIAAIVVLDEAYGNGEIAEQLKSLTDESKIRGIRRDGLQILKGKKIQSKSPQQSAGKDYSTMSDEELMKEFQNQQR